MCKLFYPTQFFCSITIFMLFTTLKVESVHQKAEKNVILGIYLTPRHALRHKTRVSYLQPCSLLSDIVLDAVVYYSSVAAVAAAAAGSCRSERLVQRRPSSSTYTPHETTSRCWAVV